jgi:hypothetical protein
VVTLHRVAPESFLIAGWLNDPAMMPSVNPAHVYEETLGFPWNDVVRSDSLQTVTRYFGGSFVIFVKGIAYNHLGGEYDSFNGQHNNMDASRSRRFISSLIREAANREIELEPDRK